MKTLFHVKYVDFGTVELDIPTGMSREQQEDLVIEAERKGKVQWHSREVCDIMPISGWPEELGNELDTVYSAEVDIFGEEGCIGTHKYDFNGTWGEIANDDEGIFQIKQGLKSSLQQWFVAKNPKAGEYDVAIDITRHNGYGDSFIDHENCSVEWDSDKQVLYFLL